MLEGSWVYLLVAFILTVAILVGYALSLASRTRDAEREAERSNQGPDPG